MPIYPSNLDTCEITYITNQLLKLTPCLNLCNNPSNMRSMPFTGDLAKDSPGLASWLETEIDAQDRQTVIAAYSESHLLGGTKEEPIVRANGASFNPKPARICQIIMKEGSIRDPFALRSSIFSPCAVIQGSNLATFTEEKETVQLIWRWFRSEIDTLSSPGIEIMLSLKLDEIRHLHMMNLPTDQRARLLQDYEKRILPATKMISNRRFHELFKASLDRVNRS